MKYYVSNNKVFRTLAFRLSKIDTKALKGDFRKAGMVLMGTGYAGIIASGDPISAQDGTLFILNGLIAWILGSID